MFKETNVIIEEGASTDKTSLEPEDATKLTTFQERPQQASLLSEQPDIGWAWLVLAASFFSFSAMGFITLSFSVLYIEFVDVFQVDLAVVGWIGSVLVGCMHLLGFAYSTYIKQCGCRVVAISGALVASAGFTLSALAPSVPFLYVTFGVIGGIGTGMIFLPAAVVIQQYFDRYRSLASGIAVSGISFGALVAGPLTQLLLDHYGWRGTLVIIGGIFLHMAIAGALYRPFTRKVSPGTRQSKCHRVQPRCRGTENEAAKNNRCEELLEDLLDFSLFKNPKYSLYWIGTFFLNVGLFTQFQHVPSRAVHHGVDIHRAAFLPTVYGTVSILSSVVFGGVGNLACTDRIIQYGVGIFSGGVIIILSVFARTYVSMMISYACYSMACGMLLSSQYPALVDLFGLSVIARAQALLSLSFGLGGLLGIPFAGFLYDITQSYDYTYYITGGIQTAGGLVIVSIVILRGQS